MNQRTIRVIYPLQEGRMVLRSEIDWEIDQEASAVDPEGRWYEFKLSSERPYLAYKPCLRRGNEFYWAQGTNKLAVLTGGATVREIYPYFFSGVRGEVTRLFERPSNHLGRGVRLRLYLPPGYLENTEKRYPVLYMHDGKNLFFPEEAFLGREWRVDETLDLLDSMNIIDQTIVAGIYTDNRTYDFTQPGYEAYGRALVEEIKPWVDGQFRTLAGTRNTAVMGSSLGGVVSFYLGWQWPEVFGMVACLSSTFWYQNDLLARVRREPLESREGLKIYFDSGWPGDNYEATFAMATGLLERGFCLGVDVVHFAFPLAKHDEEAWGARLHLPLQLFAGKLARRFEGCDVSDEL